MDDQSFQLLRDELIKLNNICTEIHTTQLQQATTQGSHEARLNSMRWHLRAVWAGLAGLLGLR